MILPKCRDCKRFNPIKATGYGWCSDSGAPKMVKAKDPACDRLKEK